jgi:hypothetical protein
MLEVEELGLTSVRQELPGMESEDIPAEERSRLSEYHKHKLFIGFLKIIPMVLAAMFLLNTILSYYYIDWPTISYISSVGLIPWLFIYFAANVFHFCRYHKMFLWYILVNNILCWIDYKFTIPVSNRDLFLLHIITAGLFLFLVLYYHQKETKESRI